MVTFLVIVSREFRERFAQGLFTEEDHPVQTFGFHRQHESLDMRIQVRALRRQHNRFGVRLAGAGFEPATLYDPDYGFSGAESPQ